jgi:hypothetical protein
VLQDTCSEVDCDLQPSSAYEERLPALRCFLVKAWSTSQLLVVCGSLR